MRRWFALALALTLVAGCRPQDRATAQEKLDAPLRQKVEALASSHQHETLSVLGKCSGAIDETMKQAIAKSGATLTSAAGDVFGARVPSDRLPALARLAFVQQLQLSQMSQPSNPANQ